MTTTESKKQLRILCHGDSLTSGYSDWGSKNNPYSLVLEKRLREALPGISVEIINTGVPADAVCGQRFKTRLSKELQKRSFDWVLILGGTNDIAMRVDSEEVWEHLETQYELCFSSGCKVLAMTVPETQAKAEWLTVARGLLNDRLMGFESQNYFPFNLHKMIPYHSLTEKEKVEYWDDGVHLTPEGYAWMGQHISDFLIPIIQRERGVQPVKPKASRAPRAGKDEKSLEEEGGDAARDISSGYVVVRKKDLW